MVKFTSWYVSEEVVWASGLLSVVSSCVCTFPVCRVPLAMTALLSMVTRSQTKRCKHRTSAGKQASCAVEDCLISDSAERKLLL